MNNINFYELDNILFKNHSNHLSIRAKTMYSIYSFRALNGICWINRTKKYQSMALAIFIYKHKKSLYFLVKACPLSIVMSEVL
jgi:hypothetical protein